MIKAKVISSNSTGTLEAWINKFLESEKISEIISVTQAVKDTNIIVTIFYK